MTIKLLDKGIWLGLCLYALSSSTSIAVANIGISLASLFALLRNLKQPLSINLDKGLGSVLFLFLSTMLLSAIFSPEPDVGLLRLWAYIYRMFPLFLVVMFVKEKKQIIKLILLMGISMLISGSYAIWQGVQGDYRVAAFTSNAMIFAGFLIQLIPLYFLIIQGNVSKWVKFTILFTLFLSVLALVLNGTRGAWLAVVATLLIYMIMHIKKQKKLVLVCMVFLVVVGAIFSQNPLLQDRLYSMTDITNQSNSERVFLWKSAVQMFVDKPFFGVGLGRFEKVYLENYISPFAKERLGHAHNNFMHILAENGIVGLLGFLVLFSYIVIDSYTKYRTQKHLWGGVVFFVTISLLIQGLTEFNFGDSAVIRMYWFILGISYCAGAYCFDKE